MPNNSIYCSLILMVKRMLVTVFTAIFGKYEDPKIKIFRHHGSSWAKLLAGFPLDKICCSRMAAS